MIHYIEYSLKVEHIEKYTKFVKSHYNHWYSMILQLFICFIFINKSNSYNSSKFNIVFYFVLMHID